MENEARRKALDEVENAMNVMRANSAEVLNGIGGVIGYTVDLGAEDTQFVWDGLLAAKDVLSREAVVAGG
jgi:hypothetical protein